MSSSKASSQEILKLVQRHHSQQLATCESDVELLQQRLQELDQLVDTLHTLPTKMQHQRLIPICGGAAVFPGSLIHTNEVLVALGDNWFTQRTAEQARQIANRRREFVKEQLSAAEAVAKLERNWVQQVETETSGALPNDLANRKSSSKGSSNNPNINGNNTADCDDGNIKNNSSEIGALSGGVDIRETLTSEEYQHLQTPYSRRVERQKRQTLFEEHSEQKRVSIENTKLEEESLPQRGKDNKSNKSVTNKKSTAKGLPGSKKSTSKVSSGKSKEFKRLEELILQEELEEKNMANKTGEQIIKESREQGEDDDSGGQTNEEGTDLESLSDNLSDESTDSDSSEEENSEKEDGEESDNGEPSKPSEGQKESDESTDSDDESDSAELAANLSKFRHVKIESPMPIFSGERKFTYSSTGSNSKGLLTGDSKSSGIVKFKENPAQVIGDTTVVAGNTSHDYSILHEEAQDTVTSEVLVSSSGSRARTRSFTKTISDSFATRQSNSGAWSDDGEEMSSKDDSSFSKCPVGRRVSWADQSSVISAYFADDGNERTKEENSGISSGVEQNSSEQTSVSSTDKEITDVKNDTSASKEAPCPIAATKTIYYVPSPAVDKTKTSDDQKSSSACANKPPLPTVRKKSTSSVTVGTSINTPADFVKLVSSVTTTCNDAATGSSNTSGSSTPALPKKSILKKGASQDRSADGACGVTEPCDWPEQLGSVPITTSYTHEPPLLPDHGLPSPPPAVRRVVVAHVENVKSDEKVAVDTDVSTSPKKKMSKFKASRLKKMSQE